MAALSKLICRVKGHDWQPLTREVMRSGVLVEQLPIPEGGYSIGYDDLWNWKQRTDGGPEVFSCGFRRPERWWRTKPELRAERTHRCARCGYIVPIHDDGRDELPLWDK